MIRKKYLHENYLLLKVLIIFILIQKYKLIKNYLMTKG